MSSAYWALASVQALVDDIYSRDTQHNSAALTYQLDPPESNTKFSRDRGHF